MGFGRHSPERWGILAKGGLRITKCQVVKLVVKTQAWLCNGISYNKVKMSFLLEITGLDGVTECSDHEYGS